MGEGGGRATPTVTGDIRLYPYGHLFSTKKYLFKMIHFDLYYLIIFLGNIYIKGNRRLPWSMATKTLPKCKSYIMLNLPFYLAFMDESYHVFFQNQPFHG